MEFLSLTGTDLVGVAKQCGDLVDSGIVVVRPCRSEGQTNIRTSSGWLATFLKSMYRETRS